MLKNILPTDLVSLQKLIIDEKKFYLFGRNPDICDFTIDHQSCSRVHAALVYHKHLKRLFLIDLNSSKFLKASQKHIVVKPWPYLKCHEANTVLMMLFFVYKPNSTWNFSWTHSP